MIDRLRQLVLAVSIRAKILGLATGLVLFLGVGAILAVRAGVRQAQSTELRARGVSLARDLAARSAQPILTDDRYALHQLIQNAISDDSDVRYVIMENRRGGVLAHSFPSRVPGDLVRLRAHEGGQSPAVQMVNSDEGVLTDVALPILEGRLGRLRVGLSHQRIDALLRETMTALGAAIGGALLLVLAVALALTRVLTQPITELVSVTRAVSGGELTARAKLYADDEIGELARSFNVMIDKLAGSRMELLRRLQELETLNATSEAVGGKLPLGELLQVALKRILELTGLSTGWILLNDGQRMRLAAHVGLPPGLTTGTEEPGSGCPCESAIREIHARVVNDSQGACDCPIRSQAADDGVGGEKVCVPLVAGRRVVGVLNLTSAAGRPFAQQEASLLDSIGCQIGLAVENARLWEEAKSREAQLGQLLSRIINAQEAERKRIARELHDEAGQLLTTLSLSLRTIEEIQGLPDATRCLVADSKELVGRLLEELHRLAVDLRPQALDQLGLVGAIESCVREFGGRAGLETDIDFVDVDDVRPSTEVEITVYRVVQEALANVRKHAKASRVGVLLKRLNGSVVAVVEDDGVGFDAAGASGLALDGHLGLFGMQERAMLLNGRLTVESEPGRGTTVIVEIPLDVGRNPISRPEAVAV